MGFAPSTENMAAWVEQLKALAGDDSQTVIDALLVMAANAYHVGSRLNDVCLLCYRKALHLQEARDGLSSPRVAEILHLISAAVRQCSPHSQAQHAEAAANLQIALDIYSDLRRLGSDAGDGASDHFMKKWYRVLAGYYSMSKQLDLKTMAVEAMQRF